LGITGLNWTALREETPRFPSRTRKENFSMSDLNDEQLAALVAANRLAQARGDNVDAFVDAVFGDLMPIVAPQTIAEIDIEG
jgi:hypothetical protein